MRRRRRRRKRKRGEMVSEEEEEEMEEEGDSDVDIDVDVMNSDSDSEDERAPLLFEVGDKIRNLYGLNGVVTLRRGHRYDVRYNDGRKDYGLKQSLLKPHVTVCRKKKYSSSETWTNVVGAVDYVDRGGLDASNLVSGKRSRSSRAVNYKT